MDWTETFHSGPIYAVRWSFFNINSPLSSVYFNAIRELQRVLGRPLKNKCMHPNLGIHLTHGSLTFYSKQPFPPHPFFVSVDQHEAEVPYLIKYFDVIAYVQF